MTSDLRQARDDLVEALGQQSAFWGVGKVTGALFAVLYLSDRPLTLAELADALGTSKGNVSVSIRTLEHLGMVRRSMRAADRHVYFTAETDFWAIARTVLRRRQKPEFDHAFALVERSLSRLRAAVPEPDPAFALARVEALKSFYDDLDGVVSLVLRIDPRRLRRLLAIAARIGGRSRRRGRGERS